MNRQAIDDHLVIASTMEWDELVSMIIELEMDLAILSDDMTDKEYREYRTLLKIYEDQKALLVQEQCMLINNTGYELFADKFL